MEIITGVERRRRWRSEEKQRVLAELEVPGVTVTEVARRHDISRGLIWTWRRQARRGSAPMDTSVGFLPMRIAPDALPSSSKQDNKLEVSADTTLEIKLADGTTIRVGGDVTAAALRRVLGV
ncbi:IS66-like element accessory protein TnpA, partial [Acidisoma sp. C75]